MTDFDKAQLWEFLHNADLSDFDARKLVIDRLNADCPALLDQLLITYTYQAPNPTSGARFHQFLRDVVPAWAIDIRLDKEVALNAVMGVPQHVEEACTDLAVQQAEKLIELRQQDKERTTELLNLAANVLMFAKSQLNRLWVSHHANRTDHAIELCDQAMQAIQKELGDSYAVREYR